MTENERSVILILCSSCYDCVSRCHGIFYCFTETLDHKGPVDLKFVLDSDFKPVLSSHWPMSGILPLHQWPFAGTLIDAVLLLMIFALISNIAVIRNCTLNIYTVTLQCLSA